MRRLTTPLHPFARTVAAFSAATLVFLAGGCASPPSHFYTLSTAGAPAAAASSISLAVGPVSIPTEVNRPQIVARAGPNQVRVDEFNLWAAPLQNAITSVLAGNLVSMLGTPHVTLFPQTLSRDVDYRVALEVQGFESTPGESASLDAVWTLRRMQDGKTVSGRTTLREPAKEKGYDALAAAHSRALARVSRDIADAVRTLHQSAGHAISAEAATAQPGR
jgi:hypothetical protein